ATGMSAGAALAARDAGTKQLAGDAQDRFLTLLITQLQNQDPLNPMDNAQITSQMAQLSTVHGIGQLNDTLLSLAGQIDMSQSMQAAGLIGKGVLVPGSKVALGGQGASRQATPFGVDVVSAAEQLAVTIHDGAGSVVRKLEFGPQPVGVVSLQWNGKADGGVDLPDGAYAIQATASGKDGASVPVVPLTYGMVSSVGQSSGGMQIDLGLA